MSDDMEGMVVVAKCVGCKTEKEFPAAEVAGSELPMCPACGSPMYAKAIKVE